MRLAVMLSLLLAAAPRNPDLQSTSDPRGAHLRLLTLNTWGLPFPVAVVPRSVRFPRIARYLREAGADLAGLQEVWNGARRLLVLDGLRFGQRRAGDTGLALWTRLPAGEVEDTSFSVARGFDRIKGKGVLRTRVEAPEVGSLWVFVTHLQAGRSAADAGVRALQVDELLGRIEEVEGPAVVLGDFNLHARNAADRESARRLARAGLVDAAERAGRTEPTYARARLDRIYLRDGDSGRLWAESARVVSYEGIPVLSDHRPLVVEVRLERGSSGG